MDAPIVTVKPKGTKDALVKYCEIFYGLVDSINDDAACFTAMGLVIFDLTNGALPKDPIEYLRTLNEFILATQEDPYTAIEGPIDMINEGGRPNDLPD